MKYIYLVVGAVLGAAIAAGMDKPLWEGYFLPIVAACLMLIFAEMVHAHLSSGYPT